MRYYVQYELCALLFLLVITARFFSMRRFPSAQNRLFGMVLCFAIADLTLDIVGSYTIEFADVLPSWINYVINTLFYSLQVIFPALMVDYIILISGRSARKNRKFLLLFIPVLLFEALLVVNPFTDWIFYLPVVDGVRVFTHGKLFNFMFLGSAFYVVASLILVVRFRKDMLANQFNAILAFEVVLVSAVLVQFLYPAYLLTGVAITVGILLMFLTMQNPEDLLDLISGVFNYTAMILFLRTRIDEKKPLWLVAADVGGIRRVNSSFGVSCGNMLFASIGAFFNGMRGDVWAFRMIGTRFLLVASTPQDYRRVINEVEARFEEPWKVGDAVISLTVTVRHFGHRNIFKGPEDVINLIDVAYAEIGSGGWGATREISMELLSGARRSMTVESAIREALRTGEGFELNYQPLYSPASQGFVGAEVLLRLRTPDLGRVSPAEFIPVAEKTGLILQIDEMVIRMACDFLRRNPEMRGLGIDYLNINLSAAEFFRDPTKLFIGIVSDAGVDPGLICYEVTETAAASHQSILEDFMREMIGLGHRFALDDFGSGYANINRVADLPFSCVKLDRELLLQEDAKNRVLFRSLIRMFREIGLATVAEGVETDAQAERVTALGVDAIQGFRYAHPMPEREFLDFIREHAGE